MRLKKETKTAAVVGLALVFALPALAAAQQEATAKKQSGQSIAVTQAASEIRIDGRLDEEAWKRAGKLDIAYEWTPGENVPPPVKSEVLVTYDMSRIYIGFRCYDPEPGKIRAHLMDRDSIDTFVQDDHISFMLDTFNDERRAFQFRVNPLGVQADAAFSELDGIEDFSWDAIWESAGQITDFGYTIEVAIPFNQLRFPKGGLTQTWGFEADRSYPRNVRHRISTHIRDRNLNCLICQFNKITGFEGITPGSNLQFTPTFVVNRTDERPDFPAGPMNNGTVKADPGLTARWGVTPNIILNATANPDFSQVEADAAQLDVNTRFALYYPEKRPFFLEGADFFATPYQAVFTRTVADPLWGGKVTGKAGRSAFGFFTAQDQINNLIFPSNQWSDATSLDQNVYSAAFRYRYDVGSGSTLGALYAGRIGDDYYNHAAGVDGFFRLGAKDQVIFQYLRSETRYPYSVALNFGQDEGRFGGDALFAQYVHQTRNFFAYAAYQDTDAGFRADSGYMPRVDVRMIDLETDYILYGVRGGGKSGRWFNMLRFWVRGLRTTDHSGRMTDSRLAFGSTYQGPLQSSVTLIGRWNQEYYNGKTYDVSDVIAQVAMKPAGGVSLSLLGNLSGAIDYTNSQSARALRIIPEAEFGLGAHVNFHLSHSLERLDHEGRWIYTANILQGRLIYNFNTRCFLRLIVQYRCLRLDPAMYSVAIDAKSNSVFTQFLFSYKLNPQTVLFLGYSDNSLGGTALDLTRTDRTFFLKIGYAWVL
jgi:hypothetical protein